VVDLVQSTCVRALVLEALDQFKGLMAANLALGRWSLGARARRLPDCHQHRQVGSGKGAATMACRRLALLTLVVVRWSKNIDVISIICLGCFVIFVNS
jgi:hypothetical protein